ncbi:hypothetical protein JCM17823_02560 [Halorubrum gandharaense]
MILGAVLALLFFTSPFGDAGAMADASTGEVLWTITIISLFVGIVPVAIGMLWFPYIRRLNPVYLHAVLALSAGVLAFVAVEMTEEAIDYAGEAADPLLAGGVALAAGVVTFLIVMGASRWSHRKLRDTESRGLGVAYLVAVGLGLHSVGEGIAIGGAFMIGEVELVLLLVIGFLIHNITEGPTVVAAVARDAETPPLRHFAALGLIAGGPLVLGGWIGVVAYSPMLAAALLAVGIGAILQVVLEVVGLIRLEAASVVTRANTMGFVVGFVLMFLLEEVFLDMYLGL